MSLYQRVKDSLNKEVFKNEQEAELVKAIEEGYAFFSQFNRSRMELAFSIFSEDMKKALFEVLFFLHVNEPRFEEHQFICSEIQKVHGVKKEVEVEEVASLFVPGAPTGVVGISELSPIFKDEFMAYAQQELGTTITENKSSFLPIYSIASLGSIGTVGHKQTASDLDLQVQYELEPFLYDGRSMTDAHLKDRCNSLINHFSKKYQKLKKVKPQDLKNPSIRSKVLAVGHKNFKNRLPKLYEFYITRKANVNDLLRGERDQKIALMNEIIGLQKLYSSQCLAKARAHKESLLKEKIRKIQKYVQRKFPKAEVYLFAYSNDDYRDGKHGTTLESKEASGSAYELILNYEVLMPGIQFTPMIPIHFLMPGSVNSNRALYESIVEKIRFQFTGLYDNHRQKLVDLGSTPPLTSDYLVAHSGAIYWESFKASSGNLPKAMLNLLRFEMLFDERFNTSVIELIKNPKRLDKYAGEALIPVDDIQEEYADYDFEGTELDNIVDEFYDDYGLEEIEEEGDHYVDDTLGEEDNPEGMSIEQLFKMEDRFPSLRQDPWWLRYKALKIGFGPDNKMIQDQDEKLLISRVIDLGFALHIRVSDIIALQREGRKADSYREKFLAMFLEKAFTGNKRRQLEHISNGEVDSVIKFEKDLKFLFQRSMDRVQQYVDQYGGEDKTNQDENRIWFHYYQQNFEPPKNVVRRDILSHLKVPRGRLQIGINKKQQWFFRSIQKSSIAGGKYDPGLMHLPDEVELFENESFLHGIAHCILNGYYGVLNRGTLKESRTVLEYSVGHTEVGKRSADRYAFIRPDIVDRLVDRIDQAFPPQEYDFRDCIFKEKEITEVFICLNLLEYGRVSFMYRDNLKTWYVDDVDHPPVEKNAQELFQKQELILHSRHVQNTIKDFFTKHSVDFDRIWKAGGLSFWVNPNSVNTYHAADKFAQKEQYLAATFKDAVYQSNSAELSYSNGGDEEAEEEVDEITV